MKMQVISLIPTKRDHKQFIYLSIKVLQFLEDLYQKNISGYFIKSFKNYCNPLSKSRIYMTLKIYSPIILFEDNATCITQLRGDYIKGDKTKHISPEFFYTHQL
jgi:hypothetical protein